MTWLPLSKVNNLKPNFLNDMPPRAKLLLEITNIKTTIQQVDDDTAAFERLARLILSDRQSIQSGSCRNAVKLIKACRHIWTFASTIISPSPKASGTNATTVTR